MNRAARAGAAKLAGAVGIATATLLVIPSQAGAWEWPTSTSEAAAVMSAGTVEARVEMLRRLAGADATGADVYLRQALSDREPELRAAALQLIGRYHLNYLLDEAVTALTDRLPEVRIQAIEALGTLGVYETVDPLTRMLSDSQPAVRVAAIRALAHTGSPTASSAIALALRDRDRDIATAAADALASLGNASSVFALLEESASPDDAIAIASIDALGELVDPRATAALLEATQDGRRPDVASAAVRALGAIGTGEASDAIIGQVLTPSHPDVQVAALQVLASTASPGALLPVLELMRSPELSGGAEYGPYLTEIAENLGAAAWPELSAEWDRGRGAIVDRMPLLRAWLVSGDLRPVHIIDGALRDGLIDAAEHEELLGIATSEVAVCRRLATAGPSATAFTMGIRTGLGTCLGEAIDRVSPPTIDVVQMLIQDDAFPLTDVNLMILAHVLQETQTSWDDLAPLLALLPSNDFQTWRRLLDHPDSRVAREASFVLGDSDASNWAEADMRSIVLEGTRRPWVIKALHSAPVGPLCALVVDEELWPAGDAAVQLERLELADRCPSGTVASLERQARDSTDFWLRRRAGIAIDGQVDSDSESLEARVDAVTAMDATQDVAVLLELIDDADAVIRAAALLRLLDSEASPFSAGDLIVRARNARTAGEEAALRLHLVRSEADPTALAPPEDAMVEAVVSGRPIAPDGDLVVSLLDTDMGRPLVNGPLLVVFEDGDITLARTDREGRWSSERPVAFVFHRWNQ